MAAKSKLLAIAEEYGEPLDTLIPRIVAEEGSVNSAAKRFGVSLPTLQNWCKREGFIIELRYATRLVRTGEKS